MITLLWAAVVASGHIHPSSRTAELTHHCDLCDVASNLNAMHVAVPVPVAQMAALALEPTMAAPFYTHTATSERYIRPPPPDYRNTL